MERRREFLKDQISSIEANRMGLERLVSTRKFVPLLNPKLYASQHYLVDLQRLGLGEKVAATGIILGFGESNEPYQMMDYMDRLIRLPLEKFPVDSYGISLKPDELDDPEINKDLLNISDLLRVGFLRSQDVKMQGLRTEAKRYDEEIAKNFPGHSKIVKYFDEHQRLIEFAYTGELHTAVRGVSLNRLMEPQSLDPVDVFSFVLETAMSYTDVQFFDSIVSESYGQLGKTYIQIALQNILFSRMYLLAALHFSPGQVDQIIDLMTRAGAPIARMQDVADARNLVVNLKASQDALRTALFNPKDKIFPRFTEALAKYLKMGGETAAVAIYITSSLQNPETIKRTYRQAVDLAAKGTQPEFYGLLADSLLQVCYEYRESTGVRTKQDLTSILRSDEPSLSNGQITSADLGNLINAITSNRSTRNIDFVVDDETCTEAGLITPESAVLRFDPNRPRIFTLTLTYKDEVGEVDVFRFEFDTSKKAKAEFNWDAVELPGQLPEIRGAIYKAAAVILTKEKEKAEALHAQRNSRQVVVVSTRPASNKGLVEPYLKVEKEPKTASGRTKKGLGFIEQVLAEGIKHQEDDKVRIQILLPDGEGLEDIFPGSWSRDEINRIIKGLTRGNKNGVFDLERIVDRTGPHGIELYRVRIGPFRVIVTPSVNINGEKVYRASQARKKAGDKTYGSSTFK